jgi:hypothetical protein
MTARLPTPWLLIALSLALTAAGCRARDGGDATPAPAASPTAAQAAATPSAGPVCGLNPGLSSCAPVSATSFTSTVPPDICNPNLRGWTPNQAGFDQLSWSTLVSLAWPADLSQGRGVPDPTQKPGAVGADGNPRPVVWDTWKAVSEVFHYDDPSWTLTDADWNKPPLPPPGCPTAPAGTPVLRMTAKAEPGTGLALQGKVSNDVNQAFSGPLTDQTGTLVRYEIRMNQSEFDQIVQGNYYKAGADVSKLVFWDNTTDPNFHLGAMEVKSAWKALSQADWNRHRYYQRQVLVYDEADPVRHTPASCTLQRMGLVGLHVLHKTASAPDWFWATFEHVDNVPEAQGGGAGPFSFNNPACQPAVTPAQCAGVRPPNSDPRLQCCPNLQRYKPIGPPPDDPYKMPRGPEQVTRLIPVAGSGCNQAYGAALQGTFWQNYVLVGTQWLNQNTEGPPFTPVVTPATLRNSVIETYFAKWDTTANPPKQVETSNCIGCHTGGTDFSYIFLAAKGNDALRKAAAAKAGVKPPGHP